ncbi:hypothetical protein [Polyangium sorediatum]|uniref:Lipoprotein n=1 Tax=Polyangium sorediatum TaxID=889274 RepID=A0ABT6NRS7_9BACT|nr:hypothetical protein [Polyangium sorediatum]MDI1431013.1 hypothetical protein [Polyangium sorediatum]
MTRLPMLLSPLLLALVALGCKGAQENQAKDQAPPAASTTSPKEKKAPRAYPAAEAFALKPLAVGQWIRIALEFRGQPPGQVFVRIVGKEGDAFWYEVEANMPTYTSLFQFLVEGAAEKGFDKNAVRKLRRQEVNRPVLEESGPPDVLRDVAEQVEAYAALLNPPDFTKAERKDVKVTAGLFQGSFVYETESTVRGDKQKERVFRHPAVPITGFVRAESTQPGGPAYTTELLEMHETGARAVMGL